MKQSGLNLEKEGTKPFPNTLKWGKVTLRLVKALPCRDCGLWPVFKVEARYESDSDPYYNHEKDFGTAICVVRCPHCENSSQIKPETYATEKMEEAFVEAVVNWNRPIHPNYLEAAGLMEVRQDVAKLLKGAKNAKVDKRKPLDKLD